jgi:hypothetical protein
VKPAKLAQVFDMHRNSMPNTTYTENREIADAKLTPTPRDKMYLKKETLDLYFSSIDTHKSGMM